MERTSVWMSDMALLQVENLSKRFGALRAVDEVSFAVEVGDIFGIAGPNGSGKSTLFNAISGIPFGPDSGRVTFDGQDLTGLRGYKIARLGLARTFQRETSFDTLTVYENVLMGAAYGIGKRADSSLRTATLGALDLVGLQPERFNWLASDLSVYERKCLMLATALAMSPRILLLDEPVSGLTKAEIAASVALIRRIAAQGITIILIEHVLSMLLTLSQRLMVLNQGRVLIQAKPDEVVNDPAVIRAYLGSRRRGA